jgi:hypothetical protein
VPRATSRPALLHKPRDEEPWPLRINRWPQRPIEIKRELHVCREPLKICLAETKMLVPLVFLILPVIVLFAIYPSLKLLNFGFL